MTEKTFEVHPTNERPQRFKAEKIGSVGFDLNDLGPTRRRVEVYKRPDGNFYLEVQDTNQLQDTETTVLHKDLSQEEVVEQMGWSRQAVAFFKQQDWVVVEDND